MIERMNKILMIADDLTGALDTGVAFASAGIATCVGEGSYFTDSVQTANCSVQVTVIPTRHMVKEEAYHWVYDVAAKAKKAGFTCIFKKIDSALRGNVGAELAATLAATGEKTLYLVPAFPKMNRVTRQGVQYIDGAVPVAQSVFGKDPFNPVHHSSLAEVIAETASVAVFPGSTAQTEYPEGIAVFDAQTEEDVRTNAAYIFWEQKASLVSGCAGLAAAIPEVLDFPATTAERIFVPEKLIVFCGSVNPISIGQCTRAEQEGAPRFHLLGKDAPAPQQLAEQIAEAAQNHRITILDTGSADVQAGPADVAECGKRVAGQMAEAICGVSSRISDVTLFIIGGDTLIALIHRLKIETIIPVAELLPGVVLAKYSLGGKWQYLISKSGGFGEPDLLKEVSLRLALLGQGTANGGGLAKK